MYRTAQDIYDSFVEFARTFGAFQLFFLRLLRHCLLYTSDAADEYQRV